ncbi:TetR/AcrR family transcriptional regulator [Spirillospora sp. CA-108201]
MPQGADKPAGQQMRADARRNVGRILTAAEALIAEDGAEASLEEIARRAGVGSATLHRHFPTRRALLEAVFRDRVAAICAQADDLVTAPDPGEALFTWLRAVGAQAAANRGLSASVARDGGGPALGGGCHDMIVGAGERLLARARAADAVRPEITALQLLKLVAAVSTASERDADGPSEADQLLAIAIDGVRPR